MSQSQSLRLVFSILKGNEKANQLYNELIPLAERVLGEDNPDTLMYYQSKAFFDGSYG